jgi:hypothetical protein
MHVCGPVTCMGARRRVNDEVACGRYKETGTRSRQCMRGHQTLTTGTLHGCYRKRFGADSPQITCMQTLLGLPPCGDNGRLNGSTGRLVSSGLLALRLLDTCWLGLALHAQKEGKEQLCRRAFTVVPAIGGVEHHHGYQAAKVLRNVRGWSSARS